MFDMPSSSTFGGNAPQTSSSSTSSLSGMNFGPGSNNAGTNLIVNYLPQDLTERELYSMFSTMGPIETCRIMRDVKVSENFNI